MKKILKLCCTFLFTITNNNLSSTETTIMSPKEGGSVFLTLKDTGIENSTFIQIGNNIILGDGTHPITLTANTNTSYPITYPNNQSVALIGIDNNGRIQTTSFSRLESNSKEVFFACDDIGGISTYSFNLVTEDSVIATIGIDENNYLTTGENKVTLIGSPNQNSIIIDNTGSSGIIINSSLGQKNISLNAGNNGYIIISGNQIETPSTGTYAYLGLDDHNNLITLTDSPTPPNPPIFTNLTATGRISLGTLTNQEGSNILVPNNLTDPLIIETSNNIIINTLDKDITLNSKNLTSDSIQNIIIGIDKKNNLISSNKQSTFIMGDPNNVNIAINNAINPNITLSGKLILNNQNFSLPGNGETVMLTIDSQGKLGILLSSKKFKENIEEIVFDEETKNSFDTITAYQFNYIGENKKKIGLIAEEIAANIYWKNFLVVKDCEGKPYTIDYNNFFMSFYGRFCSYKKEKDQQIKKIENKLEDAIFELNEEIKKLKQEIRELKKEIIKAE